MTSSRKRSLRKFLLFSKIKGLKNIWNEYKKNKLGLIGLIFVILYLSIGVSAPIITNHDPIKDLNLAQDYAMPEWVALFPMYSDLPRNTIYHFSATNWNFKFSHVNTHIYVSDSVLKIKYNSNNKTENIIILSQKFSYNYKPPRTFLFSMPLNITTLGYDLYSRIRVEISKEGEDKGYLIYESGMLTINNLTKWNPPILVTSDSPIVRELNNLSFKENPAGTILSKKGIYNLNIIVEITSQGYSPSSIEIDVGEANIKVMGLVYGILGTNYVGADVWSQFVWGIRQSLLVGIIAASLSVIVGVIIGLITGYIKGLIRDFVLLIVDTIYLLPLLPILLALLVVTGRNIYVTATIIGFFIWAGLAREISNWVTSLRESGYVEVARALGSSTWRIIIYHILPHLAPVVVFAFIIRIPFSILLEAGLSILGFGDPFQPSWGKMINEALAGGAIISGAWWWILPPVIGLSTLSLGFVFIGFTLDEILNPRLKVE